MKGVYLDLVQQVSEADALDYTKLLSDYYEKHGVTSEIQIDSLVLMYKLTHNDIIFDLIHECHKFLLRKIASTYYQKYKQYLTNADYDDIYWMIVAEVNRRTYYYLIPPEAPFSKYIKLYMKNWTNAYTKLMAKKNERYILGYTDDITNLIRNYNKVMHNDPTTLTY